MYIMPKHTYNQMMKRARLHNKSPRPYVFRASTQIFVSVQSPMAEFVRQLLRYMDQSDYLLVVTEYEPNVGAVRAHMDDLYHRGATLIFADHAGSDYDDAAQFMADTPTWPVKVFNTGHVISDELAIDARIVHSAVPNTNLCTYLSQAVLDPVSLEHQLGRSDFDMAPLMAGRIKSTSFDRVMVIHYNSREAIHFVGQLHHNLSGRGVTVEAVGLSMVPIEGEPVVPNYLDQMLQSNPISSDQFHHDERVRTLFICYYASQAEYEWTLAQFGSVLAYDDNYWVFMDTGTVTYPTMAPATVCTFAHTLLIVRNFASVGLKFYNIYAPPPYSPLPPVPLKSSALAMSDLVADLVPSFAKYYGQTMTMDSLIAKNVVLTNNGKARYFRHNLYLAGHLNAAPYPISVPQLQQPHLTTAIPNGAAPHPSPMIHSIYGYYASYNLSSSGAVLNPSTASINSGAIDLGTGRPVGYWCLPLHELNSHGQMIWLRLTCVNCTLLMPNKTALSVKMVMNNLMKEVLTYFVLNGHNPTHYTHDPRPNLSATPDKIPDSVLATVPLPVISVSVSRLSIVSTEMSTSYIVRGSWSFSWADSATPITSTIEDFHFPFTGHIDD
jgi:hypothetical protein